MPSENVAICLPDPQVLRRHPIYTDDAGMRCARTADGRFVPLDTLEHFVREESATPKVPLRTKTWVFSSENV
jgi:hypothetical protein